MFTHYSWHLTYLSIWYLIGSLISKGHNFLWNITIKFIYTKTQRNSRGKRHGVLLEPIKTASLHQTSDKRPKMLVIRPISQVVGQSQGVRNVTESGRSQFQGSFPHTPNAGEWRARVKNKTKDAMFFRPCPPPHSCCLNWYCNEVLTQYYQEYADFFVI